MSFKKSVTDSFFSISSFGSLNQPKSNDCIITKKGKVAISYCTQGEREKNRAKPHFLY
jgi:hypothetical protein